MASSDYRLLHEKRFRVETGEADIDISAADYTNWQVLLTIEPGGTAPIDDVEILLDLAKATTGFAAQHAAQTIQFALERKVDGTNWRRVQQSETAAISGTNAAGVAAQLRAENVGPAEDLRVVVKLSAENAVDVELPYCVYYRGEAATFTPVAAA